MHIWKLRKLCTFATDYVHSTRLSSLSRCVSFIGSPREVRDEVTVRHSAFFLNIFPHNFLRFTHDLLNLNIQLKENGWLAIETWHPEKIEYLTHLIGFPNKTYCHTDISEAGRGHLGSRHRPRGHLGRSPQVSIRKTTGLPVFPNQGGQCGWRGRGVRSGDTCHWASVTGKDLALTLSMLEALGDGEVTSPGCPRGCVMIAVLGCACRRETDRVRLTSMELPGETRWARDSTKKQRMNAEWVQSREGTQLPGVARDVGRKLKPSCMAREGLIFQAKGSTGRGVEGRGWTWWGLWGGQGCGREGAYLVGAVG